MQAIVYADNCMRSAELDRMAEDSYMAASECTWNDALYFDHPEEREELVVNDPVKLGKEFKKHFQMSRNPLWMARRVCLSLEGWEADLLCKSKLYKDEKLRLLSKYGNLKFQHPEKEEFVVTLGTTLKRIGAKGKKKYWHIKVGRIVLEHDDTPLCIPDYAIGHVEENPESEVEGYICPEFQAQYPGEDIWWELGDEIIFEALRNTKANGKLDALIEIWEVPKDDDSETDVVLETSEESSPSNPCTPEKTAKV